MYATISELDVTTYVDNSFAFFKLAYYSQFLFSFEDCSLGLH